MTTDPGTFCSLDFSARRELLAESLAERLGDVEAVREVVIEAGPPGREYDLTAAVVTDVGRLRTPLWSHARATIFCDPSVHEANRRQLGPEQAITEAAERLRARLNVRYRLETRGLTFTQALEEGVVRTWTAEHSLFRKRTAVTREDRVERAAEVDVRDLLAHFYVGPSLRLVGEEDGALLLPEANEAEGRLVTLCFACRRWFDSPAESCPECGSREIEVAIAARPARRR